MAAPIPAIVRCAPQVAALAIALFTAGCQTAAPPRSTMDIYLEKRAAKLAELEPKYGKCRGDGWRSVSVIGKTTGTELVNQLRACGLTLAEFDTSRHTSAAREHFFVHIGADRMWHFVNGVLYSIRT